LFGRGWRMLTIAGAVVAGIAVVAAAFGFLRGHQGARPPAVVRATSPASAAPATLPARVLSDRDPFSPPPALQMPNPAASPSLDERTFEGIAPEPTSTGAATTPPGSTTPPAPPADCGPAGPSECRRVGAHVIVLLRVLARQPRPSVDLELDGDPVTNLRQGDRFAGGFRLVGFNDSLCARIVFGEEGFTLCERDRRSANRGVSGRSARSACSP
jgi:hypothetical protein